MQSASADCLLLLKFSLSQYNLRNLAKDRTCFQNPYNPGCIDLFLTNSSNRYQSITLVFNGLSRLSPLKYVRQIKQNTFTRRILYISLASGWNISLYAYKEFVLCSVYVLSVIAATILIYLVFISSIFLVYFWICFCCCVN